MNTNQPQPRFRPQRRAAMTLVEVVIAASLSSLLVGGLVSAMVLTSRALPARSKTSDTLARDAAALDQLTSDLFGAISISEHTDRTLTFTVGDRDGDSNPETIRYSWTGNAGDPLLRSIGGKAAAAVAENIESFALDYVIQTTSATTQETVTVDSGEIVLASFTGWSGVSGTIAGYLIGTTSWPCEYAKITTVLPANMTRLDITRVALWLRDSGAAAETMTMSLYEPAVAGSPEPNLSKIHGTPAVVSDTVLNTSYRPIDFLFSNVTFNQPLTELVIGIKSTGSAGIRAQYVTSTSGPTNDNQTMLWTTNNGSSWTPTASTRNRNDMYFTIYGRTYATSTQTVTVDRYFVTGVSAALRSAASSAKSATAMVQIVNAPEVVAP